MVAAIDPSSRHRVRVARIFEIFGVLLAGIGGFLVIGLIILTLAVRLTFPDEPQPAGHDLASQIVGGIVWLPYGVFAALRWIVEQLAWVMGIYAAIQAAIGVALLVIGRGIEKGALWGRLIGGALCLAILLFGILGLLSGDQDAIWIALVFVALPLYPLWVLAMRYGAPAPK